MKAQPFAKPILPEQTAVTSIFETTSSKFILIFDSDYASNITGCNTEIRGTYLTIFHTFVFHMFALEKFPLVSPRK